MIHAFDTEEGIEYVINQNIPYYGVRDGMIFYPDSDNPEDIVSHNLSTGEIQKIIDVQPQEVYEGYYNNIVCTENYLLLNEKELYYGAVQNKKIKHVLKIYDYEGNCIGTVEMDGYSFFSFDERILTSLKVERTLQNYMCYTTEGFDNIEWIKLEVGD